MLPGGRYFSAKAGTVNEIGQNKWDERDITHKEWTMHRCRGNGSCGPPAEPKKYETKRSKHHNWRVEDSGPYKFLKIKGNRKAVKCF